MALEGSTALFRPPATPLAWFALFDTAARPALASRHGRPGRATREGRRPGRRGRRIRDGAAGGHGPRGVDGGCRRHPGGDRPRRRLPGEPDAADGPELRIPPRRLADLLWNDNPVPFAICLETGGQAVVSNSPELFLDVDLDSRRVASAPIKGTVPRLLGGSEEAAREALLASEKDAAEHLMIVDLIRNDLGRVCEAGSVHVPSFRAVRSFRHLHHLESTVAGTLRPETRLSDLLVATLPGGSITGAPKRAALGVIRRLEPVARGPYTGAAGFVRGDGTAVFNVAIRTALVDARDGLLPCRRRNRLGLGPAPRVGGDRDEIPRVLPGARLGGERERGPMSPDPVPFDAPAVERGFGFFETLLLLGRRAVLWAPHARRLLDDPRDARPAGPVARGARVGLPRRPRTGSRTAGRSGPSASPGSPWDTTSKRRPRGGSTPRSGRSLRTPSPAGPARGP